MNEFSWKCRQVLNVFILKEKLGLLLDAVYTQDEAKALQFKKTEEWATVEEMMSAHGEWILSACFTVKYLLRLFSFMHKSLRQAANFN